MWSMYSSQFRRTVGGTGYSPRTEEEVPDLLSPALFQFSMIDQVGQDACAAPDTGFAGGFLASSE
jgi:hypothetical protein